MNRYKKDAPLLRFATPSTRILVLGAISLVMSAISYGLKILLSKMPTGYIKLDTPIQWLHSGFVIFLIAGIMIIILAVIVSILQPDSSKVCHMVKKGLFAYEYGNPLKLKELEILPRITCKKTGLGEFLITITATTATVENIQNISPSISSSLNKKKYKRFAVTETDTDIAYNQVSFHIEDVTVDKSLIVKNVAELTPIEPTKLIVQKGAYIDLKTSGSILCAGKTRGGKTTGIVSLLLQVVLAGRDKYASEVLIIDPKTAELSQLPYIYKLDDDGEATAIIDAMKLFADTIKKRQAVLNDLSKKSGNAEKWFDNGMHPSFIFIDEYVYLRTILPKKTAKDSTDYNIDTFDGLLKRIVTTGASAGCFAIVSIAEASVESGGLPAIIRSACSTKILFLPTLLEARFIWDSEKLKDLPKRKYKAGDCWISSTSEGLDNVTFAHFPILKLREYAELGKLLQAYYSES